MRCRLPLLTLALAAGLGAAQAQDLLQSAPCRQALAALQAGEEAAAEAAATARRDATAAPAVPARLTALRRHAAQACLQAGGDHPPAASPVPAPLPGRLAQPPLAVPPVALPPVLAQPAPGFGLPPAPGAVLAPGAVTPPLPPVAPPAAITSCDAAGCWASDGTRLQRAGPNLLGPRGFCSAPGGLLQCPP